MQEIPIDWKATGTFFAALLTAAVAIVALITNYKSMKRQIATTVLSNERKEWINALRTDIATFDASLLSVITAWHHHKQTPGVEPFLRYQEQLTSLRMVHIKIKIMLDPTIPKQKQLEEVLEQTTDLIINSIETVDDDRHIELWESIVPLTRQVIAEELNGIKLLRQP